jgi:hypothetical protein
LLKRADFSAPGAADQLGSARSTDQLGSIEHAEKARFVKGTDLFALHAPHLRVVILAKPESRYSLLRGSPLMASQLKAYKPFAGALFF